jgi:hypothetical protein
MIYIFLSLLSKILLGFSVCHIGWRERRFWPFTLKIFLGVPLGMGISSLLFYCWLWLELPRNFYPWVELVIASALVLFVIQSIGGMTTSKDGAFHLDRVSKGSVAIALLSLIVAIIFFAAYSIKFPHGFFEDAWFIWNMTARFIYRSSDWTLMFSSPSALWHPDYPLLLSLNVVQGWLFQGSESTLGPVLIAGLFTFCIPGICFTAMMIFKDVRQASLTVFFLLSTPWYVLHGTEQVADVPISAYFLGGFIFLLLYLRQHNPGLLVLSGLMSGLSAWTKNEGLYFWMSSLFVCLLVLVGFEKKPGRILYFLCGSAFPLLIVLLFKILLAPGNDLFQNNTSILEKLADPARYSMILAEFARHISAFGGWPVGIFWVMAGYAVIVGLEINHSRGAYVVAMLPLLQLAGYFVIYLITPRELAWHLSTSLGRLLTQIFPLSIFILMLSMKLPGNWNLTRPSQSDSWSRGG